eukprot:SAG31_NODE_1075_length_10048_cov_21.627701_7_plen_151_part_00
MPSICSCVCTGTFWPLVSSSCVATATPEHEQSRPCTGFGWFRLVSVWSRRGNGDRGSEHYRASNTADTVRTATEMVVWRRDRIWHYLLLGQGGGAQAAGVPGQAFRRLGQPARCSVGTLMLNKVIKCAGILVAGELIALKVSVRPRALAA